VVPRHRTLLLWGCTRANLRKYQGPNTLVLQVQRLWVLNPVISPQYFRPQTVYVSPLFLQIIAYLLGLVMEEVIPGPNSVHERLRTKDNAFWRFMNPGPFSKLLSRVLSPLRRLIHTNTCDRYQGACGYHYLFNHCSGIGSGYQHLCCGLPLLQSLCTSSLTVTRPPHSHSCHMSI
jgi:hypothetical protein